MKPWRFAALAAALALLTVFAARIDGARRQDAALASAASVADGPALIPRLEAHLERTPRDGRGWVMLARLNFASDRFEASAKAYERALLYWKPLLAQLDPQSREHRELQVAVERLRRLADMGLAEREFRLDPTPVQAAGERPTAFAQHLARRF